MVNSPKVADLKIFVNLFDVVVKAIYHSTKLLLIKKLWSLKKKEMVVEYLMQHVKIVLTIKIVVVIN